MLAAVAWPTQFVSSAARAAEKWWLGELGMSSSAGSQKVLRYAFFPKARRLLVEHYRRLKIYDSGGYDINGVSQSSGHEGTLGSPAMAAPFHWNRYEVG